MNKPEYTRLEIAVMVNRIATLADCAIKAEMHIDKFIIGISAKTGFVKLSIEAIIDKVIKTAINGPKYEPASFTVLANDEIKTPKLINKRSVDTKMMNNRIISTGPNGSAAPPNNPGNDNIKPRNDAAPERMATIDKAATLPITIS